jgi:hypothetical protein
VADPKAAGHDERSEPSEGDRAFEDLDVQEEESAEVKGGMTENVTLNKK